MFCRTIQAINSSGVISMCLDSNFSASICVSVSSNEMVTLITHYKTTCSINELLRSKPCRFYFISGITVPRETTISPAKALDFAAKHIPRFGAGLSFRP